MRPTSALFSYTCHVPPLSPPQSSSEEEESEEEDLSDIGVEDGDAKSKFSMCQNNIMWSDCCHRKHTNDYLGSGHWVGMVSAFHVALPAKSNGLARDIVGCVSWWH